MESEIVKVALSQGLWAALFVVLLFWVLKTNEKRENKLTDILKSVTENLATDVKAVKEKVEELRDTVSTLATRR